MMVSIRKPLASLCLVVAAMLMLSGSGSVVNSNILLMALGALMVVATIIALRRTPRYVAARQPQRMPMRPASDAEDLIRMDSDKG